MEMKILLKELQEIVALLFFYLKENKGNEIEMNRPPQATGYPL